MQDAPAPEGDIQHVEIEKGPEETPPTPEGKEAPVESTKPEVARSADLTGSPEKPLTFAKVEAESAGSEAAKTLLKTNQPREITSRAPSEPSGPAARKIYPLTRSALQFTAIRQTGFKGSEKKAA